MADMKKHPTVVRYYESSAQSATLDNETVKTAIIGGSMRSMKKHSTEGANDMPISQTINQLAIMETNEVRHIR